jgi:DNA-binding response OmpR family regulator
VRLLIVEDYEPLRRSLAQGLSELGVEVTVAGDGRAARQALDQGSFDIVILDLMIPFVDGMTVLRGMRQDDDPTMVLVLSAKDQVKDRVNALASGADDYLVKPFAFEELVARVRALFRRKHAIRTPTLRLGKLVLDLDSRTAGCEGVPIPLSDLEYSLLECLMLRHDRVVTREQIWMSLYEMGEEPSSNVVDVYIGYLRRKLLESGTAVHIRTCRGHGYCLSANSP